MFRKMRRTKQQLSRQECLDILSAATHGVLAVHGDGGYPYAVPMSYVLWEDRIYLHCAGEGHKLDAVKANGKVSFCVVAQDDVIPETYSTDYRSVIVFGRAAVVEDPEVKRAAIIRLAKKYAPDNSPAHMNTEIDDSFARLVVLEITPEHISGKESLRMAKERNAD